MIEKEASIVNGPSISKGRNDAIHGTPPGNEDLHPGEANWVTSYFACCEAISMLRGKL